MLTRRTLLPLALSLTALAALLAIKLTGPPPISPDLSPASSASAVSSAESLAEIAPEASAAARPRQALEEERDFKEEPEPEEPAPKDTPPLPEKWLKKANPGTQARAAEAAQRCKGSPFNASREVHGKDSFDIVFTPAARVAMRRCKETLIAYAEARAAEAAIIAADEPLPRHHLEEFFLAPLEEATLVTPPGKPTSEPTAVWLQTQVALPDASLLGVTFQLFITGGSDDVLVLFQHREHKLRKSMVIVRHDIQSITEGQMALDFVARPVDGGGYHIMTVHSHPWISSAWRGAHLRIFAPGPTPDRPTLMLSENNSARIGESGASLYTTPTGFKAYFTSWTALTDLSQDPARTHLHAFAPGDGSYRRVGPYVSRIRDIPDEWIQLPWSEAAQMTTEEARKRIQPIHARLQKKHNEGLMRGKLLARKRAGGAELRWLPDGSDAPIRFIVEGEKENAKLADVVEEEPAPGVSGTPL